MWIDLVYTLNDSIFKIAYFCFLTMKLCNHFPEIKVQHSTELLLLSNSIYYMSSLWNILMCDTKIPDEFIVSIWSNLIDLGPKSSSEWVRQEAANCFQGLRGNLKARALRIKGQEYYLSLKCTSIELNSSFQDLEKKSNIKISLSR